MHLILNQTTVTDNNFTKLCIKSSNGFQCSWPLLELDTPNQIFYIWKWQWIYDIVQYHHRNKHLPEILITKFDKYNQFNSIKGNKKSLPFSAHEHPAGWYETIVSFIRQALKQGGGINLFIILFLVHVYFDWCTFWTHYSFV
jgi:hypothetical protein